jgi:NADP-dependent 3-hydroxy acid dehydrogenase YdfG
MTRLTVLIVGATSGVGKATARQLADAGHRVLVIGRDPERAQALGHQLTPTTGLAAAIDISTPEGWDLAAEWASQRADRLDVLINAAGGPIGSILCLGLGCRW